MMDSILSQVNDGVSVSIGTGAIGIVLGFAGNMLLNRKNNGSSKQNNHTTCPVHGAIQKEINETKADMKHVHRRLDEMIQGQANNTQAIIQGQSQSTQAIIQAINGIKK